MDYILVTYRSRSQTLRFHEFLIKNGLYSEIVNTPKEAGVGCGLSVKISPEYVSAVKKAVRITNFSAFAGIFGVKISGGVKTVRSIY